MLELSAETRSQHLERMSEGDLDVLVIGGGIVGAGIGLDAAARGLRVGLVERDDFASGTSGRSSRMIHGGARYLRNGDVRLVYESLRERGVLLRNAPHLVRPSPFLTPLHRLRDRIPIGLGLTLYDALATGRNISRHSRVDETQVERLAPGLAHGTPGLVYWDCLTDDARLVIEILREAARRGALMANRAEVVELIGDGVVRGARVVAEGRSLEIRARVTVNATGAWADRVHALADPHPPKLRPSKGIHLVLDRARLPIRCVVTVPSLLAYGSFFVLIPWGPRVYIGPTDTPYDGPIDSPTVEPEDVSVVLAALERAFGGGFSEADVIASWSGVRPLLDAGPGDTRDLSRRHAILQGRSGLITVTGGKLTTYRAIAEQVVDRACRALGEDGRVRTETLPLGLTQPLKRATASAERTATRMGLPPGTGTRLVQRYGDDWPAATALITDDAALGEQVVGGFPVLKVELELARRREMAMSEEDVLVRRTRLALMGAGVRS
jgi:glycerol-3-phosphate dehydrogenase